MYIFKKTAMDETDEILATENHIDALKKFALLAPTIAVSIDFSRFDSKPFASCRKDPAL